MDKIKNNTNTVNGFLPKIIIFYGYYFYTHKKTFLNLNTTGPTEYEHSISCIEEKFESVNTNVDRTLYVHRTCATDTGQVQHILDSVTDMILARLMNDLGM